MSLEHVTLVPCKLHNRTEALIFSDRHCIADDYLFQKAIIIHSPTVYHQTRIESDREPTLACSMSGKEKGDSSYFVIEEQTHE